MKYISLVLLTLLYSTALAQVDITYGTGGLVTLEAENDRDLYIIDSKTDQQNRNLLFGMDRDVTDPEDKGDWKIFRLLEDGNLDPSFGTDGLLTIDASEFDVARGIDILPDGKIRAYGQVDFVVGTTTWLSEPYIVQLNSDGSFDQDFGVNDGRQFYLIDQETISLTDYEPADDGGFYLTLSYDSNNRDGMVLKAKPNGSLDNSFGTGGKVIFDFPDHQTLGFVEKHPDGSGLLVGGTWNSDQSYSVVKLDWSGEIDLTFGLNGFHRRFLDSDNEIFIINDMYPVSDTLFEGIGVYMNADTASYSHGIRLQFSTESGFTSVPGNKGLTPLNISVGTESAVHARAAHRGGLYAGWLLEDPQQIWVRQYATDGTLDTSLGNQGTWFYQNEGNDLNVRSITPAGENNWLLTGFMYTPAGFREGFALKISTGAATSATEVKQSSPTFELFPNPCSETVYLSCPACHDLNILGADWYDAQGRHLRQVDLEENQLLQSNDKVRLEVPQDAVGLLTLSLRTTQGVMSRRLVRVAP